PGITIPSERVEVPTGSTGQARTDLRPAGKAVFGDEILDVVSQGDFIAAGTPVRVVSADGTRLVVAAVRASVPG
ncbi:MAG: hypothetical protein EOP84_20730, partial [Verrucomicrobiaceae bacterium]